MKNNRNWAGNLTYSASKFYVPESVDEVQEIVASSKRIKVLGTRHSFNRIADCTEGLLSLQKLNRVINLDKTHHTVTVEGGIRYGELGQYLHSKGYALHNLASLPHITVAGACATATHGSGHRNQNLAAAIHSMEVVKGDGDKITFSRNPNDMDIAAAAVGLGALGVITKITLSLSPSYQMSQFVYENLPLENLEDSLDDIFSSAYSVSLFTDWKEAAFNQVWLKRKLPHPDSTQMGPEFFGSTRAKEHRHPVPGMTPENCTEQMGIPGPWYERLPHFRMDFVPSAGDELQSEYFVPRQDAYQALCAINRVRQHISPLLYVSEVRTIAEDDLWMSPCYKQESVGIHFTWKSDWEAVRQVLPLIEAQLAPFHARPHWGKLFTMTPSRLQSLYAKLPDFQQTVLQCDPEGKFQNEFLHEYVMANYD